MKFKDTMADPGGFMPCCLATIGAYTAEHASDTVPDGPLSINCLSEGKDNARIVLEGGVWHWRSIAYIADLKRMFRPLGGPAV